MLTSNEHGDTKIAIGNGVQPLTDVLPIMLCNCDRRPEDSLETGNRCTDYMAASCTMTDEAC
jgi:hypothetical protein